MRRFAVLVTSAVCLLSGCGGGTAPSTSTLAPPSGGGSTTVSLPVTIDSTVAVAASSRLTIVTSPLGEFTIGSAVDMPALSDSDERFVLAGNTNHDILLASVIHVGDTGVTLSPKNTALALARMVIGGLPTNLSGNQIEADIQGAAEFTNLQALVTSALAAGTAPLDYPGVADSIDLVLFQISTAPTVTKHTPKPLVLATPTVTTPLPYEALSNGFLDSYSISVTSVNAALNGINLRNGITIHYAASGSNSDGTSIPTGSALSPDGIDQKDLPAHNPLFDVLGGASLDPEIGVPGNGKAWNLTIRQTPVTRTENGIEVAQSILKTMTDAGELAGLDISCAETVANSVLGSSPVAPWATLGADAGIQALQDSLSSTGTWTAVGAVALKCAQDTYGGLSAPQKAKADKLIAKLQSSSTVQKMSPLFSRMQEQVYKFGKQLEVSKVMRGRQIANLVYDSINASLRVSFLYNHWSDLQTTGVCEAMNPTTSKLEVENCPASLQLTPSSKSMLVGDNFTLAVASKDVNGNTTLTLSGLQYQSSDNTSVSVDTNGILTALKQTAPPVTITATEPITGATGNMQVIVSGVTANISVSPLSIVLGASATLSWSSTNASSCSGTGSWSGSVGTAGTRLVTPSATGSPAYGISCTGPGGPATSSATLTVKASTGPTLVTAWVKHTYSFFTLNSGIYNVPFVANESTILYPARDIKAHSGGVSVGDQTIICCAVNNQIVSPGDTVWSTYPTTFDSNGALVNHDVTLGTYRDIVVHLDQITDVVTNPSFNPPSPVYGGDISITTSYFTYDARYTAIETLHFMQYQWVQTSAYITDADGDGYDDAGGHGK